MASLMDAQQTINANPTVSCTVSGVSVPYVARYKWFVKGNSFGRMALWLDNSGGRFNNLAANFPHIKRGRPVVLTRGLAGVGSAAVPTFWIETILFTYYDGVPYLVLDCIDWVNRLRYYRYAEVQSWTATQVQTIVASILAEVGLTLAGGAFTSLLIDYEIGTSTSLWTAIRDLMSKIPEELYGSTGTTIGWKVLDSTEAPSYSFDAHPTLDDSDVAESTAVVNSVTVYGGADLEFSATEENLTEIGLLGYRRRRRINDRTLTSTEECAQRALAELEYWNARSSAGVIVARPHFTLHLFDVVSSPAPIWGGPAIGQGHVIAITEWYNFGTRKFDQSIQLGEIPTAAARHLLDTQDEEAQTNIPETNEPGDAGGGPETGSTATPPPEVEVVGTTGGDTIIAGDLGLGAVRLAPGGLLHGYDQSSGFLHWENAAVGGTAVTVIADGAYDVTAALCAQYVLKSSGGTPPDDWQAGVVTLEPGTNGNLYNEEATLRLSVSAGGAVTLQRTAGASTFKVALWLLWI